MKPDEANASSRTTSRANFFWAGTTRQTVKRLHPQSNTDITLKAGFFGPGVYNLNKFKFLVFSSENSDPSEEQQGKLIICPFQHLVRINDQ